MLVEPANNDNTERFCILNDGRISPVIQPYFVLGWRDDKLVLVPKEPGTDALKFADLRSSFPDEASFPLKLGGEFKGKGLCISNDGKKNQQNDLYGQAIKICPED